MSTSQISRRYAVALFELIGEGVKLDKGLAKVAAVTSLDEVCELLASPEYPSSLKQEIILAAAGGKLGGEIERLVAELAERNKLTLLPEISAMVEEMVRLAESEVDAEVTVAVAITAAVKTKISKALAASTGKKVRINVSEDKAILGGMIIQIGDRKIDYSLRTKLAGLHRVLAA